MGGEITGGRLGFFLKLQPYCLHSLTRRLNEKLGSRFYGPYQVVECVGEVAYKLELLPDAKIHLIFHISQLKKSIGDTISSQPLPPPLVCLLI